MKEINEARKVISFNVGYIIDSYGTEIEKVNKYKEDI